MIILSLLLLAGPLYLKSYCKKRREQKRKLLQDADAIQSLNESLIKKGKAFFLYHKNFYTDDYNERDKKALLEQPIYKHIENAKDENFIEANLYMYGFQFGVFLKVFFIDLLYALGIGTLLLPFSKCILRWRFMNNTSYFENQRIVQFLGVFTLIYIIYGVWSNTLWQINTQALEYFEGLLFICVTNASIAAFMNPQIPKLLSSYALKQIPDTNRFHWKFLFNDKKDIEQEINSTFLRLNIDASLFYATFLQQKTPSIYLRHYKDKEAVDISGLLENLQGLLDDFQQNMALNKSLPIILYHTPVPASELLNKIPFFERYLFKRRYLSGENRYDETKAFGYQIALSIANITPGGSLASSLVFILSLVNWLVCFVYDIMSHNDSEQISLWMSWSAIIIWFVLNLMSRCLSAVIICQAVIILVSKLRHMQALYNMILTTRLPLFANEESYLPVFNIFDVTSLKSWSTLRKLFMHFNEQRLESLTLALAVLMGIQISTLAVVALFYFGIFHSQNMNLLSYLTFFGTDATLFLISIFILVLYCVKVNSQYQIHRDLIRVNKGIVLNLFRLYPSLIGADAIEPGSFIYNCGFKILQEEFGPSFPVDKIDRRLQALTETYDQILQDLEYEEIHHPFKLFGIPVRQTFLSSLGALIITSLTPLIKKLLGF